MMSPRCDSQDCSREAQEAPKVPKRAQSAPEPEGTKWKPNDILNDFVCKSVNGDFRSYSNHLLHVWRHFCVSSSNLPISIQGLRKKGGTGVCAQSIFGRHSSET